MEAVCIETSFVVLLEDKKGDCGLSKNVANHNANAISVLLLKMAFESVFLILPEDLDSGQVYLGLIHEET